MASIPTGSAPPRPKRTASDQVADDLRAFIQRNGLEPGDRLGREEDLAREFGVSRPTIREALRLLASSRLIRSTRGPGGGIFVASTPEQGIAHHLTDSVASLIATDSIDVDELIETRMLIEVPLAALAAQRATDAEIAQLKELVRRSEESVAAGGEIGAIDDDLHRIIAAAARNQLAGAFMAWVVEILQPMLRELVAPAVVDSVMVDQHREIVAAIEKGDPQAAERAMREHIVYTRDLVVAVRELS
jgi:GntR family transcriptional repressor for pyruvate dehydrogenase complex